MFITAVHGETLVKALTVNNIPLELVRCPATLWCGTAGYASEGADEPDIGALLEKYQSLCGIPKQEVALDDWSCCISINYWQEGAAPRGIFFGQQVLSTQQDARHDVYTMPESLYLRAAGNAAVAQAAFGRESCELYEIFGAIKDVMGKAGYVLGTNGAQEIELYNHGAGLSYAYVQVIPTAQ